MEERRLVCDEGWNVLGETVSVNRAAPVLDLRYIWGLDLSGTETGAVGVHGLVAAVRPGAPAGARRELPVYDGNVERVVTETGEVSARYEYGPFGEEITRRGVGAQPYRFSTKYHDEETGLLYYGYYAPHWGRWLSRDPIGEQGGVNLYGFVGNDPCNWVDVLGRELYQPGGPLKGVTWGEDEHFRPGEKDPFAKRPDHSSPRYNLKTKEKECPCTANWTNLGTAMRIRTAIPLSQHKARSMKPRPRWIH